MKELILVGRGGEGVVLASQILADTLARAGFWVQAFPEFTAERRGAPISAFLRWDGTAPIHRRYKVRRCDVLVALTPSSPVDGLVDRIRPGGLLVVNRELRLPWMGPFRIARVPASRIAARHGVVSSEGRAMGNMAVVGACVRLLAPDALVHLEAALTDRLGALAEANVLAAREGYEQCTRQHACVGDRPFEIASVDPIPRPPLLFAGTTTDSLSRRTGAWALERPLIHDACTACAVCALFCPEGVIVREDGHMLVDYLHCKGCGICEVVCPVRNAIEMEGVPA
jgi:pyruvate ferredoxin oxidoreductase gamma subunit